MKKNFIAGAVSGLLVGALIFGGVSAFAAGVNPFAKSKITGVFTVIKSDGTKVADAPVIDGSTYVPVRAVSEAAGIQLRVEGKTIVLESTQVIGEGDALSPEQLELTRRINKLRGEINGYNVNVSAEKEALAMYEESRARAAEYASEAPSIVEGIDANIAKTKARIAEYQAKIDAANAEIAELQAQIDASK